jgi:succinoglycan biosynthesis transport protein ExoP
MDNPLTPLSGSAPFQLDRPQAEDTYYLRDIVGVLRERWLLFLLVLGLVAAPGVWIVMSRQPTYVATAKVIIEPNQRMRLNIDSAVTGITLDNESVRSEAEVLTSPDLAQRVVDRLLPRVAQDLESKKIGVFLTLSSVKKQLGMEGTAVEPPLRARFLKRLTVSPVERSRVISVSYRAYDAELAAEVANTIVSEYVDMALELKRQGTREAAEWLARRMAELQSSIDASERTIEDYRKRTGLIQGTGSPLVAERLDHANLALAQARSRMVEAVARLSQLGTANTADKTSEVLNSPVIQRLRGLEAELATRVAELSPTTGEASPHLVTARNSLARVQLSISEETARIQQNLRKEVESVGALRDGLQQEIESLKRELSELQTASIGLRALEREAEANRAI